MITVLERGTYRLIETRGQIKVFIFNNIKTYAWINAGEIGEILVTTHKHYNADCTLATGNYRLYQVKSESDLTDQLHLELHVGEGEWQGYLLPAGLPTDIKKRNRIIPTKELITIHRLNEHCSAAWL